MTSDSLLLRPAEAAKILNVTERTLARNADKNKIGCMTLPSGQRRYYKAEVNRILHSGNEIGKSALRQALSISKEKVIIETEKIAIIKDALRSYEKKLDYEQVEGCLTIRKKNNISRIGTRTLKFTKLHKIIKQLGGRYNGEKDRFEIPLHCQKIYNCPAKPGSPEDQAHKNTRARLR